MSLVDPIADAMVSIKNSDKAAKKGCICKPASKLLGRILEVMKKEEYIKDYKLVKDGRSNLYVIELFGRINDCRAIKPRHAVKKNDFEKFEKRYLPAKDMGMLIVTTPEGVFSHKDVKNKRIGGRLLAYIY